MQLAEVAVTQLGWYMDEPFPQHERFETITALSKCSINWRKQIEKDGKNPFRPETLNFTKTDQEKAPPTSDKSQVYRVVGYAFPKWPAERFKSGPDYVKKNSKGVGFWLPEPRTQVVPWANLFGDTESPPVVVVSPLVPVATVDTRYYALISPDGKGLCHPHAVAAGEVFFRAEYRNASTNQKTRAPSWNAIVGSSCVQSTNPNDQRLAGSKKKGAGGGGLMIEPFDSVLNEIRSSVAAMQVDPLLARSAIPDIMKILERLDWTGMLTKLPENPGMLAFVENVEFLEVDATLLVDEVTQFYGPIDGFTPEMAITIWQMLEEVADQIAYSFADMPSIFAEGVYQIQKRGMSAVITNKVEVAMEIMATVHRHRPSGRKPPAVISEKNEHKIMVYLQALHTDLTTMLRSYEEYIHDLKDVFGHKITSDAGPWDFWQRYGRARDTDSARASMGEIGRYVVHEVNRGMEGVIVTPLKQRVEILGDVLKALERTRGSG